MKIFCRVFFVSLLCLIFAKTVCAADSYVIDPVHSSVGFSIKHLTVSEVTGNFKTFSGLITLDPQNSAVTDVESSIETKSINTQNEQRDEHLRNPDFFDADANPVIRFKSTSIKTAGNTSYITGDLTIKGVTKSITLPLKVFGPVKSPMSGDRVIGVSGETTINRQDFGVQWNKQMDNGGLILGDEVTVKINLEAHNKTSSGQSTETTAAEKDETTENQ